MQPALSLNYFFFLFQVIGQSEVAVPTHLFKVIIVENSKNAPVAMGSFIVPNEPIGFKHALKEYQVDIKELERISGLVFTPKLDRTKVKNLCTVDGCKLMEREAFELHFIWRKLDSANTPERLEKVWAELAEKNLKPTRDMKQFYEKKKIEFEGLEKKMSERAKGWVVHTKKHRSCQVLIDRLL